MVHRLGQGGEWAQNVMAVICRTDVLGRLLCMCVQRRCACHSQLCVWGGSEGLGVRYVGLGGMYVRAFVWCACTYYVRECVLCVCTYVRMYVCIISLSIHTYVCTCVCILNTFEVVHCLVILRFLWSDLTFVLMWLSSELCMSMTVFP